MVGWLVVQYTAGVASVIALESVDNLLVGGYRSEVGCGAAEMLRLDIWVVRPRSFGCPGALSRTLP
jgi:hypothetical protein